jgi:tetrathionate reductase subunit B
MKAMIVDVTRCNGCYNCQIACKDEHVDNDWSPYAKPQPDTGQFWMHVHEIERGSYPKVKIAYLPTLCMQCQQPSCVNAAKNGAVYKRNDGIIIIDAEKSKGQTQIVSACPYGAIFWNSQLNIPQKCTFCAHLLDKGWKIPRCVEACPTAALIFGEYEDLKSLIKNKQAEVLSPEFKEQPSVYYVGLPKRFVSGTVLLGDKNECAENAEVVLVGKGIKRKTKTNNYGDFEFEGLKSDENFSIRVAQNGYKPQSFKAATTEDVYLGQIVLRS